MSFTSFADADWDSEGSYEDGSETTQTVVDTTEDDEEVSFRLKDLATAIAEQQALLLRQTEILHTLAAMVPGGESIIKDPIPVLKTIVSVEEEELEDETCSSPESDSDSAPSSSASLSPQRAQRRETAPLQITDGRTWTSRPGRRRQSSLLPPQPASDDILQSVNMTELTLKLHNLHYDTPLGNFIGSGIAKAKLYERWAASRGSAFGDQLLDLMTRTARNEGTSDEYEDDNLSRDCQIFGITGNLVVTKGWVTEQALFNSLRDDAQSEKDIVEEMVNPSEIRNQRVLQIYNLTPRIAASLCSKGHFMHIDSNFAFLSSYINFQNSFQADFSRPEHGIFIDYHFAYLSLRSNGLKDESSFPNIDSRGLRRYGCFPPDEPNAVLYESRRSFSTYIDKARSRPIYKAIELCEDYFVKSPGLLRKRKSDNRRISRWPRIQSLNSAPTFLKWLEQSFEVICVEWNLIIQRLEQKVKNSDVLFNSTRVDYLFEDPYERSKTYVWALRTLQVFERIIYETLQTWDSFSKSEAWRRRRELFWFEARKESYMSEECFRRLKEENDAAYFALEESISSNVRSLEVLRTRVLRNISEIVLIRDGLFHGPAVREIKVSVHQNDNNIRIAAMAMAFFPLTLATTLFGVSGIPDKISSSQYFYTLIFFTIIIVSLLNIGGLSVVIRTPFRPYKPRLQQHQIEGPDGDWAGSRSPRGVPRAAGVIPWGYLWYILTHPRKGLLAALGYIQRT